MKSKKIIIATVSTIVAIAILWFCFGGKSKSANYIIETAQAVRGDAVSYTHLTLPTNSRV